MTWGRGFFRAWLVLLAIWIGLSVYFNEPKTYTWLWHAPKVDFESPSGQKMTADASKSNKELAAEVAEWLRREDGLPAGFVLDETPSKALDELLAVIVSARKTTSEQATQAWLVTFVPPLALLVIGLALAWILRGFRGKAA